MFHKNCKERERGCKDQADHALRQAESDEAPRLPGCMYRLYGRRHRLRGHRHRIGQRRYRLYQLFISVDFRNIIHH